MGAVPLRQAAVAGFVCFLSLVAARFRPSTAELISLDLCYRGESGGPLLIVRARAGQLADFQQLNDWFLKFL